MNTRDCLSKEQIRRFALRLDKGGEERDRAESHVADCDACRLELVSVWRESRAQVIEPVEVPAALRRRVEKWVPLRDAPGRGFASWRRPLILAPVVAIFLLAALAVGWPLWLRSPVAHSPVLRGQRSRAFAVIAPEAGAVIRLSNGLPVGFRWRAGREFERFRLEVIDGAGERVYEVETDGDHWNVETGELGLGDFYWTVRALRKDGSSASGDRRSLWIVE